MNLLTKLKRAKQLLSSVKFTNEPLVDGSLIEYTNLEVGGEVVLLDAAGNASLLADGAYKAKSGLQFTIENGVFASIEKASVQSIPVENPKKQAQAADSPEDVPAEPTTGDTVTEVEQADVPTEDTSSPADVASSVFTLEAIGALIDKKLLPVWDAINSIQNCIVSYPAMYKSHEETLKAVEEIADTVTKLSKAPSSAPIERQINPFTAVPKDIKQTAAYKILSSK